MNKCINELNVIEMKKKKKIQIKQAPNRWAISQNCFTLHRLWFDAQYIQKKNWHIHENQNDRDRKKWVEKNRRKKRANICAHTQMTHLPGRCFMFIYWFCCFIVY